MKTSYCFGTLKKPGSYDLCIENVKPNEYNNPYIISSDIPDVGNLKSAYIKAIELKPETVVNNDCIVIELTEGEYRFDKTLILNKKAKSNLPIVFKGLRNVRFLASMKICGGWVPYKNGIYKHHVETDKFRQLYVNGKPAVRARFPKKSNDIRSEVFKGKWLDKTKELLLPKKIGKALQPLDLQEVEVHVIEAWTHSIIKPSGFFNEKNATVVELADICKEEFFAPRSSKLPYPKVWLENDISFLNTYDEWLYDFDKKDLYYYPKDESSINDTVFEIPVTETIIEINSCSKIRFENIEFAFTNWNSPSEKGFVDGQGVSHIDTINGITAWRTPPCAINVINSNDICVLGCNIHGTGAMGIKFDGNSNDIFIYKNHFYDIGAGAVSAGSFVVEEPFESQISKGVRICDNVIERFGQSYLGGIGVLIGYSQDVVIDHNDISYGSYTGISVGWGWGVETPMGGCKIRNNRVTHVIENHLYDGAGLYILGRHLANKMNVISGNYLEGGHGYAGLYFDEKSNNYTAFNNFIGKGKKWFLLIHDIDYAVHDILIENNFIQTARKYINSYSSCKGIKRLSIKKRNIKFHRNISPVNSCWEENKQRIYDNSGVRRG